MIYSKELIAERLKEERRNYGRTQMELAKELNYSKPTIIEWERGNGENRIPDMKTLLELCNKYNCEVGYLLGEYDTRFRENATIHEETGLTEEAINILKKSLDEEKRDREFCALDDPNHYHRESISVADFISFMISAYDPSRGHHPLIDIIGSLNDLIDARKNLDALPKQMRQICDDAYSLLSNRTDPHFDRSFHNREKLYKRLVEHRAAEHEESLMALFDRTKSLEEITEELRGYFWDEVDCSPEKRKEQAYYITLDLYNLVISIIEEKESSRNRKRTKKR